MKSCINYDIYVHLQKALEHWNRAMTTDHFHENVHLQKALVHWNHGHDLPKKNERYEILTEILPRKKTSRIFSLTYRLLNIITFG